MAPEYFSPRWIRGEEFLAVPFRSAISRVIERFAIYPPFAYNAIIKSREGGAYVRLFALQRTIEDPG
jgi:hypothetical protein